MRLTLLLVIAALITACTSESRSKSLWGEVITLGQSEQDTAPVLWPTERRVTAAWVGADDAGVHQDAIILQGNNLLERVVLPLPPVHPFAQQLIPANDNYTHLLWLDASPERENRLYAALITPELQIERGPTLISSALTLRYAAVSDGRGGLWVVWSGGLLAEPGLYAQYIDSAGRPRQPNQIAANADWPTLVRANDGSIYLFWLRPTDRQIYSATLENGNTANIQTPGQTIELVSGDRLVDVSAALDTTRAYLFWNITRADGTPEAWFISSSLNSHHWSFPGRLGTGIETGEPFETGFNSGAAKNVLPGTTWLAWAAPLAGQFDVLPAAVYQNGNLAIIYLRNGVIAGYQTIVTASVLIGAPALSTDQNRHLYLAWAEPNPSGYADLKLTTTQH